MITSNNLCIEQECYRHKVYNLPGLLPKWCSIHKKDGMVDTISKKCNELECDKQPSYNLINLPPKFCKLHHKENMINVKHPRCLEPNCNQTRTYNYDNLKPEFCSFHKKQDMINVKHSRCLEPNCNSSQTFNLKNLPPRYCLNHKTENMVDTAHTKCNNNECTERAMTREKYCSTCLRFLFPLLPRWKYIKQKEIFIVKKFKELYPDLNFSFDKKIECQSCSRRRPDIFLDLFNYSVIIEIDENQHNDYTCENKRMMEIFESLGNRPVVFIRFNPDRYDNLPGIFTFSNEGNIKPNEYFDERFNKLIEVFNKHLVNKPAKEITIEKLFYT
jgi:hypothetical protein